MRSYRYDPAALDEYEAAAAYYTVRDPLIGRAFLSAVEAAIDRARRVPRAGTRVAGTPVELDVRRTLLGRFPFSINYALLNGDLYVLAVADTRRRPGYWLERLEQIATD